MILTNSGVLKLMQRIKSYIASQLNTKAPSVHTHTISEIDDLSSLQMGGGYTKSEVDTLLNGKSDTGHTHTVSDVTDFPTLSTVATSGDYDDLSNKPTIPVVDSALSSTSTNTLQNKVINTELSKKANTSHTHTVSDVTDFPSLATVATSGSYNDLTNKPTTMTPASHTHGNITNDGKIGSNANKPLITTTGGTVTTGSFGTSANTFCEGNDSRLSDARTPTAHTHSASDITSGLATVATSGSYNDLSNKPTIPTVNNATLTIQKNGTTVKTFTANASSNVTANITVPTKTSELTNDSGFLTSHQSLSNYSTLANTIKSLSISGKTITYTKGDDTTGTLTTQDNNTWTAMVGATSSSNGSVGYVNAVPPKDGYNTKYLRADGTWQVPPDHTYTVNNATLTIQKNGTTVKTFTANASSNVTANITVPTKTSDLTNDSHVSITTETDTTSTGTPAHGGTFTCIDSVTRDSNGHVTKVNTKTVTLPSDSNTDTLVTQNVSTANENHPILLSVTKDATTNQGAKTSIFASGVKVNPSTGTVTATAFSGNLTGNVTGNVSGSSGSCTGNSATATKATNNANGKELTNTIIKGLSISGKTITYTQIDGTTGTLTTQDTNTTYSNFVKSGSGAKAGLVPAPSTTAGTTKYLREDGTWQVPPDHTYTVNNATLTIQKNGTTVKTFTANQSTNATANITVPTKTSELTNDSGFITSDNTKIPLAGSNQISGSLIPSTDGTVNLGSLNNIYNITYSLTLSSGSDTSKCMALYSGSDSWGGGSALILYAKDCTRDGMSGGEFVLGAVGGGWKRLIGSPNGTLTWDGQPIQYVSDQRLKQQITEIDDKLLDAWEDVELSQFKYNDAVDAKKDKARLHTGYVVQQIDKACKSHGVDISTYGLYCHEEYPEETEEVEVENEDGTKTKETKVIREASEHYSLRYTETLVVECAYLRRENARLKQQMQQYTESLSKLEERLKALEQTSK